MKLDELIDLFKETLKDALDEANNIQINKEDKDLLNYSRDFFVEEKNEELSKWSNRAKSNTLFSLMKQVVVVLRKYPQLIPDEVKRLNTLALFKNEMELEELFCYFQQVYEEACESLKQKNIINDEISYAMDFFKRFIDDEIMLSLPNDESRLGGLILVCGMFVPVLEHNSDLIQDENRRREIIIRFNSVIIDFNAKKGN